MIKINVFDEVNKDSFINRERNKEIIDEYEEIGRRKLIPLLKKSYDKVKEFKEVLETFDEYGNTKQKLSPTQKIINDRVIFFLHLFVMTNEALFKSSNEDIDEKVKNDYIVWAFKNNPLYNDIIEKDNYLKPLKVEHKDTIEDFNYNDFGNGIIYSLNDDFVYDEFCPKKHKEKANWEEYIIENKKIINRNS